MIAHLRGTVLEKGLQDLVVDVGGVGYLVHVSLQTLASVGQEGESVQLRCHTHVREDALALFGFASAVEQRAFELLIGVSGIGPKLALTVLSGMSVEQLLGAIADGDHRRLQTIPGVGKKTAERMVVELKDSCAKLTAGGGSAPTAAATPAGAAADVVEALANLGYKKGIADKAVQRVLSSTEGDSLGAEQLLRAALKAVQER